MSVQTLTDSTPVTILAPRLFDGTHWHNAITITLAHGRIARMVDTASAAPAANAVVLPPGSILTPGFIDLQVNGGGGVLLNDAPSAATVATILAAHRTHGTTGFLPTLITDCAAVLQQLADNAAAMAAIPGVLGLHVEGPFLNPARKGVHPAQFMRAPSAGDLAALTAIAQHTRVVVTLAPEYVPQGTIAKLVAAGIRVSIGHSDATAAQMLAALDEGATGVTHLYNAMSQITPREPGVTGTALDEPRVIAGIICDGHHVASANLRLAYKAVGPDRLALVTDAMPSLGAPSPTFQLQGRTITLNDGRLTAPDGTLAGAHLGMNTAVRNAMTLMGATLTDALIMASRTPACFLGLDATHGHITIGTPANLTALTADHAVIGTWIAGVGTA